MSRQLLLTFFGSLIILHANMYTYFYLSFSFILILVIPLYFVK